MRAVDVEGFAGGFTRGVVEAGFEVVAKRELKGGFGAPSVLNNLDLINPNLHYEEGAAETWSVPPDVDFVFGNPPCSAFSALTGMSKSFARGADSKINACMWALAEFGARTTAQVIAFESVQPAFSKGIGLMRALRAKVEEHTGKDWHLYHVCQNANVLGGAAFRPRYFFVISRVPFGVHVPEESERGPATLRETIGDLEPLTDQWESQAYQSPALSPWAEGRRSQSGCVDGHYSYSSTVGRLGRMLELEEEIGWAEHENVGKVLKRYYDIHGKLPVWAERWHEKLEFHDWNSGPSSEFRWKYENVTRVVDGATAVKVLHPSRPRFITLRECARIQGFPDDWKIEPLRELGRKPVFYWGKGIPVEAGRWLSLQVKAALEGNPHDYRGVEIGDRENAIDVSYGRERLVQREKRCIQIGKTYPNTFLPTPAPRPLPVPPAPPPFIAAAAHTNGQAGKILISDAQDGVTIEVAGERPFTLSPERAEKLAHALLARLGSSHHNPEEVHVNNEYTAQAPQPPVLQAALFAE